MSAQVGATPRQVSKENPHVVQSDSKAAELLGIRLIRLVEQLIELKILLNTRLAQYQPHQPDDPNDGTCSASPGYNNGIYFDNCFTELDEGFKLIDECKEAIHRAEI